MTQAAVDNAAFVAAYYRHDIPDCVWNILPPLLPGGSGKVGRPAQDNRRFSNAVFWTLSTGSSSWRNLPPAGVGLFYLFSLRDLTGVWAMAR